MLMRRENRDAPFHDDTVARPREVEDFEQRWKVRDCCTADGFCLDLDGTPGNRWNKSATRIFVDDFLDVGQYTCQDRDAISRMFRVHIRTIQLHYKKWREEAQAARGGPPVDKTDALREHARQQRKYTVRALPIVHRL